MFKIHRLKMKRNRNNKYVIENDKNNVDLLL